MASSRQLHAEPDDLLNPTDTLNLAFVFPIFDANDNYERSGHARMEGAVMAAEEINANPTLLPQTTIKFEVRDSARSTEVTVGHALDFAVSESVFAGRGTHGFLGASSSKCSIGELSDATRAGRRRRKM